MHYTKFLPATELKPFVECYFVFEGEAIKPLEVQSPPSGYSAIVFNYGDPACAYQNSDESVPVPKAFACGQFTSNYRLVLEGQIGMVGIVLKPTSFYNFFAYRMSQLVNSRIPLSLLFGDTGEGLWQRIKAQSTHEARIQILHEFLSCRLSIAKSRLSRVDEAVECFDRHNGRISVEEVAAELKISRRYLEKKFLEKVGVSPKFYARVKRFSVLSNKVAHSERVDWQDVVFESGFHDQSHLTKEFLEFNKMSPSDYHRQHRELIRFVEG